MCTAINVTVGNDYFGRNLDYEYDFGEKIVITPRNYPIHFRNGKILYQTEDHSLVNNLIKLGRITSEEAKKHPQRHVITRAIQGSKYATESDVVFLKDIQAGDFIFMCSDGVLEHLTNEDLSAIFASNNTESIKDEIMTSCSGRTKDNYSFYIIPIQNVFNSAGLKQNILSFLYSFI